MSATDDLPYHISGREVITEDAELRVQILTLAENEFIPWHYHSAVSDIFLCLEGTMVVETRAPRASHELSPGDHLIVPKMTAHYVSGKNSGPCRFNIVQGVGIYDFVPIGEAS